MRGLFRGFIRRFLKSSILNENGNFWITNGVLTSFTPAAGRTAIEIPAGVTSIGTMAFWYCSSLTSIKIPDGVTSIGNGIFERCSSLTSVDIPDSVTSIGDQAFYCCSSLTSVDIPDGVTSIGDQAFYCCTGLTSIKIPDGVTSIGDQAFYCCTGLISVVIGSGVTSIGNGAFRNCTGLTSVDIPDSVTSIGHQAFWGCSSLRRVILPEYDQSNPLIIKALLRDSSSFNGCTSLTEVIVRGDTLHLNLGLPAGVTQMCTGSYMNPAERRLYNKDITSSFEEMVALALLKCYQHKERGDKVSLDRFVLIAGLSRQEAKDKLSNYKRIFVERKQKMIVPLIMSLKKPGATNGVDEFGNKVELLGYKIDVIACKEISSYLSFFTNLTDEPVSLAAAEEGGGAAATKDECGAAATKVDCGAAEEGGGAAATKDECGDEGACEAYEGGAAAFSP